MAPDTNKVRKTITPLEPTEYQSLADVIRNAIEDAEDVRKPWPIGHAEYVYTIKAAWRKVKAAFGPHNDHTKPTT